MRADVLAKATEAALSQIQQEQNNKALICLTPRGQRFTQSIARELSQYQAIIFLCGRFEGIDQRVIDHYHYREISLGDFILSGGEIAATAIIDACVRLRDNVLGNPQSIKDESFYIQDNITYPQYTKPNEWMGYVIPDVLRSGHHERINLWRQQQSLQRKKKLDSLTSFD